ncbi:MAG: VCBS repeat-containing protein [Acidobacteria bacterium]|nr:VCBS repeat-containing protein [Acidobacteriota bacterium]
MQRHTLAGLAVGAALFSALASAQGPASDFKPDTVFSGSGLGAWKVIGTGTWTAEKGEVTGKAGPGGSWLVLDQPYQDLNFFTRFQCSSPCDAGVLFRTQDADGGRTGILLSLKDGDLATYRVTITAAGALTAREALRPVGPFLRSAPPAGSADAAKPLAPTGAGRGGSPITLPTPLPDLEPPSPGIRAGQWNLLNVVVDSDVIRSTLNQGIEIAPGATEDRMGYGPIALYVGSGDVRFKDLAFKDLHVKTVEREVVSPRFRMQRLDDFYYAWGAGAGDFNHDKVLDVVSGPYYYLGPDYTTRQELYAAPAQSPTSNFAPTWTDYAFDFTGDGWTDVLAGESRPMTLYVNPRGAHRRWVSHRVLPQITGEFNAMHDLDGDGTPEILFVTGGSGGAGGSITYAKVHPTDATQPWPTFPISQPGLALGHGLGAGDINGDGRVDVVQAAGWWEQPPARTTGPWRYHAVAFGRWGRAEGAGGALAAVYDVNGDGLNDVVTGLNAHGFGLAWFEQKRGASGTITFERHMIIDDYSTSNAGGVTMSEMHAAAVADIDGDGIPDFITGKRVFSHQESYVDPDPHGPAALYWFRTTRNPRAPGGAEFVPELIHNRSGVGAQFTVVDLNADGRMDIVTATNRGTFVFFGTPAGAPR